MAMAAGRGEKKAIAGVIGLGRKLCIISSNSKNFLKASNDRGRLKVAIKGLVLAETSVIFGFLVKE